MSAISKKKAGPKSKRRDQSVNESENNETKKEEGEAPGELIFNISWARYSESRLMVSLVNVISRLMWSHYESPFTIAYYKETTGYCYHSVNVITFGLAKSDHIKRLLLYMEISMS